MTRIRAAFEPKAWTAAAAAGLACLGASLGASGAAASVLVIGESSASGCYRSAMLQDTSRNALDECDFALTEETLTRKNRAATFVNRGILRHHRGDGDGALEDFDAALAINPSLGEAYSNMALVYASWGRWADAVDALDRGIALNPSYLHRSYFSRAIAREELGDVAGAYEDYTRAAELAPDWPAPKRELERFSVTIQSGADS